MATPDKVLSGEWVDADVALFDEQIAPIEALIAQGETRLDVGLANYLSLHTYARELLLILKPLYEALELRRNRIAALELERAIATWRRPRGRPPKRTLADLASVGRPKPAKKIGRPAQFTDDKQRNILAAFLRQKAQHEEATGTPITDRGFLRHSIADREESRGLKSNELEQWVKRLAADISAWRHRYGAALRHKRTEKSEKSPVNTPNFEPLSRFMAPRSLPRVQQPPERGKGKRGDANTSPTARGKGPHRAKP